MVYNINEHYKINSICKRLINCIIQRSITLKWYYSNQINSKEMFTNKYWSIFEEIKSSFQRKNIANTNVETSLKITHIYIWCSQCTDNSFRIFPYKIKNSILSENEKNKSEERVEERWRRRKDRIYYAIRINSICTQIQA